MPPRSLRYYFPLLYPLSSSVVYGYRMRSTRSYRLILRLLTTPGQSAQWDPQGRTCYCTSSTVGAHCGATRPTRSLPPWSPFKRPFRIEATCGYGLVLHPHIVPEQSPQPDLGSWRPGFLCNLFRCGKISSWPLVQHASAFYNGLDTTELGNNILAAHAIQKYAL